MWLFGFIKKYFKCNIVMVKGYTLNNFWVIIAYIYVRNDYNFTPEIMFAGLLFKL